MVSQILVQVNQGYDMNPAATYKTAETWEELSRNARLFRLDQREMDRLKPFFDTIDREIFRYYASSALTKFPMEDVQVRFSQAEFQEFLFLCIVANYGALEAMCRKEKYPDSLYTDMVPDFRIWADTMKRDLGKYGFTPRFFSWAAGCLSGRTKAFGRLQCNDIHFFPKDMSLYRGNGSSLRCLPSFRKGNPSSADLTKGDKCINLHIPSGAPLRERDCIMSLKKMSEFSADFHPDYDFKAFVCYSWLLDPQFQKLLKPESNIVRFQKLGHILPLEQDETDEVIWRIWGAAGRTLAPDRLPESNSMERTVSSFLKRGGRFCEGLMVIFRDELPELFRRMEEGC